ncbi:MAG: pseudouridine synthase, partial [bacterium]
VLDISTRFWHASALSPMDKDCPLTGMPSVQKPSGRASVEAGERLQNVLARRGVASRRRAADWIAAGRVTVSGQAVREPGWRVTPGADEIRLDGRLLPACAETTRTVLLYKPAGVICSADSAQGQTVCDWVRPLTERLVPVGRLDKESEGLILLSNDGNLIQRLTHPRHGQAKRYEVTVTGPLTEEALRQLRARQELDGYLTRPARVQVLQRGSTTHTLEFILGEGRHHQVRRLCGRAGLTVTRLLRTSVAGLTLAGLRPGEWRELTPAEISRLQKDTAESRKASDCGGHGGVV